MSEKEFKEYVKEMMVKYDYYEPKREREEVLKLSQLAGKKMLDMGSGKGWLAILAAKTYDCEIISIDSSSENLKMAIENAKKDKVENKIDFINRDARKTGFEDNSFDVVIAFNLLHHIEGDYLPAIKEMFRISRNRVVITEISKTGAEAFDKYIRPEENHRKMALDLEILAKNLNAYGTTKIYNRKLMSTFVCLKN